ncbi:wax ester/triacylglycerol synthase domain-containing protein [Streptomyces sp. NPDC085929]|uniref:wax ester/triacylglycerol synthase domain-containing protein n=1 Tax=Streptomyces sp. NPDC085929 TaxID=3365739 RepID=UPI0037D66861
MKTQSRSGPGAVCSENDTPHIRQPVAASPSEGEFGPGQDRAMLEWARLRPDDGFVIGLVLRLRSTCPARERVATVIASRLHRVPVLAEQLAGPPRRECWQAADTFDAADHVHILEGVTDPHDFAELMANQPIPEGRPRWDVWLGETGRQDEYLLAYRVHHAAQDGAAVTHTLKQLLDTPAPATSAASTSQIPAQGSSPACTASRPGPRLLASAHVPVDAMRAISRASGASLHDVYLAGLASALRAWLPATEREASVPVRVPFNVRLRGERQDRGNRVGYTRVFLPLDESDAACRLASIVAQTSVWPRERNRRLLDRMHPDMMWKYALTSVTPGDALASATMLGIHTPLGLDGAPVIHGTALPPLAAGHLFSTVLFLHAERASLSIAARSEHQHFRDLPPLWTRSLTDLAAAVRA